MLKYLCFSFYVCLILDEALKTVPSELNITIIFSSYDFY